MKRWLHGLVEARITRKTGITGKTGITRTARITGKARITRKTRSSTHQLTNSSTQNLKLLSFVLQSYSIFHPVLAKILAIKRVNSPFFWLFTSLALSVFKNKTCILHHFAFLVWLTARNFSGPNTHF